ncbi:nicotinate phosphoribosyltransferase-like [Watersipora subatra]|uniref:nicotinate phosphoribosyltransferase-like n=1 Tax=Watersipora subatra TaxID=2589382 RepID=UPI00355B52CE
MASASSSLTNHNRVVQPLLTDLYQITMAYGYWKNNKKDDIAVFDLFFRKNPFQGEFAILAGVEECMKFLRNFRFSEQDIAYLKTVMPDSDEEFFQYLAGVSAKDIKVYSVDEGLVVFPKVPLLTVEGPLPIAQLLETTLLNLVNYASLVATNAARFRLAAGPDTTLLEFGLRRAQGPDGGLSASRYCFMGGFDGTSNVLAGKLFDIPVRGTHAHAFVTSFASLDEISSSTISYADDSGKEADIVQMSIDWLKKLSIALNVLVEECNKGELAAFIAYAVAFPKGFLALVDTYDVLRSGIPNFCAVALALNDIGYRAQGIRLDSGDLAYLSNCVRTFFTSVANHFSQDWFKDLTIVASNDINEETITSLNHQGHSIDSYGIGTHLVTCQKQPALGCVYKLVAINGEPRIKLSEDVNKVTIPGKKNIYRLYGADGNGLVDVLMSPTELEPVERQRLLIRNAFIESKRAYVSPSKVEPLLKLYWDQGNVCLPLPTLKELKQRTAISISHLRDDHKRQLNPTPYKVSVSDNLYNFMHEIWLEHQPIGELA